MATATNVSNTLACVVGGSGVFAGLYSVRERSRLQKEFDEVKNVLLAKRENEDEIVTVFFQGNSSSRSQAAKYTGEDGVMYYWKKYEVRDDERFVFNSESSRSPLLLYNVYVCDELKDVYVKVWPMRMGTDSKFNTICLPLLLFLNPLCIKNKLSDWWFSTNTTVLDTKGNPVQHLSRPSFTMMNVSGDSDVKQHQRAVRRCIKDQPDKKIVLFGCSRGAATTAISFAKMSTEMQEKVKLVVLEGVFDSVTNVLAKRLSTGGGKVAEYFLCLIGQYDAYQMSPVEAANMFPENIPVAFIYSEKDTVVHPEGTRAVIDAVKARIGDEKVHVLRFEEGHHSSLSMDIVENQVKYKEFLESLYDLYL